MVLIPTDVMGKPHLIWECNCNECVQFRSYAEAARVRAFEICRKTNEAHELAGLSKLHFL